MKRDFMEFTDKQAYSRNIGKPMYVFRVTDNNHLSCSCVKVLLLKQYFMFFIFILRDQNIAYCICHHKLFMLLKVNWHFFLDLYFHIHVWCGAGWILHVLTYFLQRQFLGAWRSLLFCSDKLEFEERHYHFESFKLRSVTNKLECA